jgi:flagellar protein FlbD
VIAITQLNGTRMVLNSDLIETLEATPDTVITLTTGRKLVVRETVEEVADRVEAYMRRRHGRVATA